MEKTRGNLGRSESSIQCRQSVDEPTRIVVGCSSRWMRRRAELGGMRADEPVSGDTISTVSKAPSRSERQASINTENS